jgi:general secretion pathway protein K
VPNNAAPPSQTFLQRLKSPWKVLRNSRGMALIMAITTVVLITYLAMEISYDSLVEYNVNSNALNRLKATYAARAGVELSLLRIKTFQQAQSQFGQALGSQAEMLDKIWQFPFAWPLPIPKDLLEADKDALKAVQKSSFLDSSYSVTIEDEGSKIDLGDLVSPSKALQESTKRRLMDIFQAKIKDSVEFQKTYGSFRFEELINAMIDWQSPKRTAAAGGDKRTLYRDYPEGYPPNRSFRTIQEVRLVPGMNEDFFELLEPSITVYGMKAINPNQASKEVLKTLDPEITDVIADAIIKRREEPALGGRFKDKKSFWEFVVEKGARLGEKTEETPLVFDKVMNFRIHSTGEYNGAVREINVVVMDLAGVANTVKSNVEEEKKAAAAAAGGGTGTGNPNPTPTPANQAQSQSPPLPKGAPRIVYWGER